ncbi:MAG TPA: hypothetical protein VN843_34045 [Anaerolineales bacterium]|nr:hypothetical protein [Anaerolineales bacterium]
MTPIFLGTLSPSYTPTPSDVPTSLGYTPTYFPTFTHTPIQTNHNLYVTDHTSCGGWEVNATTDPSDGVVNYNPAQFGDWVKENKVKVVVTALWSDGTTDLKEVKLHKPEDCEDATPTPTQTGMPVDTPTPVWTPIQNVTLTPFPTYMLTPTPAIDEDGQGCSPSYWKNHLESWAQTGYSLTDDFDTVFEVHVFNPDINLEQAVNMQGGGDARLARHGTAAILNAAHPNLHYPLTVTQVIALVKVEDTDTLEEFNDSICRLK